MTGNTRKLFENALLELDLFRSWELEAVSTIPHKIVLVPTKVCVCPIDWFVVLIALSNNFAKKTRTLTSS